MFKKLVNFKTLCTLLLSLFVGGVQAQSLKEGIQFYNYQRYESAKNILTPLSATDAAANYYLGLCELANENVAGAKSIFEKYPEDYANNAGLARVYFLEKKPIEAQALLTKVASKARKKDQLPLQYAADAIIQTEGGDPNIAIEWYKKAMEVQKTGDLHLGIGDAYRKIQGGGGNAMTNYEYAEVMEGYSSMANYKMGNLWYAAKNYEKALEKYQAASSADSKNPLPYKALADAYYRVKKFKLSKENIEKYLELSDKTTDDQIQYANTLYLAKEYDNAISKMKELISKGIEKPYMYRVIGFSQLELKDYTNAKMNMDKFFSKQDAAKLIPQDHINYGKLLLKDSLTAMNANASFEKGIRLDTSADKSAIYREIAEACKEAQDYASAGLWYKKITELNGAGLESLDFWWSGVMYYYAKDYANAEIMLTAFTERNATEPSGFYWLARNTAKWKDKDYQNGAAYDVYLKWLSLVNDDPSKKTELISAYTYTSFIAYARNNKADTEIFVNKLLALDPADKNGLQLKAAIPAMK